MAWNTQYIKKLRNLVVSINKQNAYGTALLDASLTRRCIFDGAAFAAITKEFRSDADKAGKGHDWATDRTETDRATAFQMSVDLDRFWALYILYFLMGSKNTVGAGDPYTHTLVFAAPGDLPVTTIYTEDTTAIIRRYADMAIAEAEFSGTGRGIVQARFSMVGSGRSADGAIAGGGAGALAIPTITEILASDLAFAIGAPGAAVALDADRILQWSVRLVNGANPHRAPGSTLYASRTKSGKQMAFLDLVVAASENDDIETLFMANTEREVQLNINSGASAQLKFKFPHLYFATCERVDNGGEVAYHLTTDEQSLVKAAADNLVEAVVINDMATIGVGA